MADEYDLEEAVRILGTGRNSRTVLKASTDEQDQAFAAAVGEAAKKAGMKANFDPSKPGVVVILDGSTGFTRKVAVVVRDGTVTIVRITTAGRQQVVGEVPTVFFDSVEGRFACGDPDRFYTPEPGKPPRRRSAVAVVAAAVDEELAKSD